ncbi:hypothetical protein [Acetobacter fallax]|uniref:Uncharacterized protein n=1 Tax=Acetobacter fallax TaxID=1737473 RepID=A0ABX0KIQ3_9PROT|nr:hypothetical protein [Acetobacter fallax]NHO34260.1 hypothetical protein [Acetobacter fallax]NHO37809.1 hypothetical protein [Acetobacter fallax]
MKSICLQKKIAAGLEKTAAILGVNVKQYRGNVSCNPIPDGYISDKKCLFDSTAAMSDTSPLIWGHKFAFGSINTFGLMRGDYLVVQQDTSLPDIQCDTYFISRIEPGKPIFVVLTNEIISIFESDISSDNGLMGLRSPEGPVWSRDHSVAEQWPVSMLRSGSGGRPSTHLGTDVPAGGFEILMPAIENVELHQGLRVRTAAGNSYHIWSVETTNFGCRLTVSADQV